MIVSEIPFHLFPQQESALQYFPSAPALPRKLWLEHGRDSIQERAHPTCQKLRLSTKE